MRGTALSGAEKEATSELKKYSSEAVRALEAVKGLQAQIYTKEHGPVAGALHEVESKATDLSIAQQRLQDLMAEKAALQKVLVPYASGDTLTVTDRFLLQRAGFEPGMGHDFTPAQLLDAQKSLTGLEAPTRAASAQVTEAQARLQLAKLDEKDTTNKDVDEKRRQAAEAAKKTAEALDKLIKSVEHTTETMVKADEAYHAKLMAGATTLYGQGHDPFEAAQIGTDTTSGFVMSAFGQRNFNAIMASGMLPRRASPESQASDVGNWWSGMQQQAKTSDQRQIAMLQQQSQHAGADMDPKAALENTLATLAAELRIKDLHADIWSMDKERFDAQIKASQAEYEYEQKIQALREKDLEKYGQMADSIFDAMHGHSMNQWFRSFAIGQEKQVFTNAITPVLQGAGHALGGMIPDMNIPGIGNPLKGTIFDHASSGADLQQKTADNTGKTVDWLGKIYTALSGQTASDPDSAMPDIYNLPMNRSRNPLAIFGSDIGGWTGSGSWLGTGAGTADLLAKAGGGSGLTQFMSGLGAGGSNPLSAIFTGMTSGSEVQLTGAQQAGVAVGTAAMLAGAGMSIASGINQGGVGGYTKAASAGLGAAAMLDPEPISKTILASAAAITGLVGAVFGTGPQQRSKDIFNALSSNQYLAPTALNVIQGMNGTYEDFDARGNLRTSTMSAVPTVAEPYITSRVVDGQRTYYDVNGNVTSPYSGGAKGTGQAPIAGAPTIIIQAFDSESLHEYLQKPANSHAVGEAAASHLERHDGRLANAVRFIAG
jgi:hypothetical protein